MRTSVRGRRQQRSRPLGVTYFGRVLQDMERSQVRHPLNIIAQARFEGPGTACTVSALFVVGLLHVVRKIGSALGHRAFARHCLALFTVPNHQLAFDRDLIAQGEGWRIITGNLAHTNGWHLLLNLSGLAVLYSLFQEYLTGWRLPVLLLLLGTAVGLGIWWGCPQTQWYMGLSGLLHGLFVWGAMQDIRFRRHSGWLMLAGVAIKLGVDFYSAGESPVSALIGARVHIESHFIGALAGLLLGLFPIRLDAQTVHS